MFRKIILFAMLLLVVGLVTYGQQPAIKHTTAPHTDPASGQEMYMTYCASCHGEQGRGDGPVAQVIKAPMPDLTTLAQRNGGNYPHNYVEVAITGDPEMPAHGTADMPVWGQVLNVESGRDNSEYQLRVHNLTEFIRSMQR